MLGYKLILENSCIRVGRGMDRPSYARLLNVDYVQYSLF